MKIFAVQKTQPNTYAPNYQQNSSKNTYSVGTLKVHNSPAINFCGSKILDTLKDLVTNNPPTIKPPQLEDVPTVRQIEKKIRAEDHRTDII